MKSMTKKITATALFGVLAVSAFAGCGGAGSSSNGSSDAGSDAAKFDASKTISVVTREEGSGTRDAFTELTGVLVKNGDNKTDNTTTSAVTINSTEAVITNVKDNEAAIGYISLGSLNDTVKALKIGGVEATADNVKSGDYAVSRPFNIAYKGELSDVAQDFVDYIMSSDGQKIVSDNGYVTVSENAAYSGKKPSGKISVAGSSSVSPVMEKLAEAYQKVNTNAKVEIQTSDSSAGMQSAMGGTCDIGMASRDLKDEEKSALKVETIAKDGIAVIVNNANTCDDLTLDQVKSIYTGETTVWSDIIK
ncbi:MAG: substrate-binding domain-containing protein [Ruminococcus bromii]|jgi:phosphate transport system substrate-binding protein